MNRTEQPVLKALMGSLLACLIAVCIGCAANADTAKSKTDDESKSSMSTEQESPASDQENWSNEGAGGEPDEEVSDEDTEDSDTYDDVEDEPESFDDGGDDEF
ncbi:MAG: hypothetical protein GF331_16585 [Chitinivibrionales bacterium]|nr:hypothetical protein [Chitinivibrionales bacterium]